MMMEDLEKDWERGNGEKQLFDTPGFPAAIYERLPVMLKESAELFGEGPERDVFLTGSLAVLSGCLPNIRGIYFDEPCSAHLYVFITAPAGSGKGKMKWARYFGQTIHERLTERSKAEREEYLQEMERYSNLSPRERLDEDKPLEPPQKMFFIPANSSSAAFIQALADNDFTGVIFETEADTLAILLNRNGAISAMCCAKLSTTRVRRFSGAKTRSLSISRILTWLSLCPEPRGRCRT
jgi:hypothetical protein